jgi:hypothetical protein
MRHANFGPMDDTARSLILKYWLARPDEIRFPPASELALTAFERAFGAIPEDFRWFLAACGGGVVGSEWIDGVAQLEASHKKQNRIQVVFMLALRSD